MNPKRNSSNARSANTSGATILKIQVTPNKRTTKITQQEGDVLFLDVHAKPENNKANEEVERFLSKQFGTPAKILSGRTSKRKLVRIQ